MNVELEADFERAIAIENTNQRSEFISKACEGNETKLARLTQLVRSYFAAEDFMVDSPSLCLESDSDQTNDRTQPESAGQSIGPYLLEEEIGRGGMATVFRASQQRPIRRTLALKVIRHGAFSDELAARMALERQALAVMNHQNIAKLFDSGVTEHGHPFFVMEFVGGNSITKFCSEHELPQQLRIGLLIDVCAAIDHAHRKGVIHRDIKPSNILVSQSERDTQVKVIDFGIAKIA
ncbi:MAG: serine/threonine-protein kinase, partial [Planctomycetota bacterium]